MNVVVKDGAPRDPAEVVYYANERRMGTSAAGTGLCIHLGYHRSGDSADEPITRTYTLVARSSDPYLDEMIQTDPVEVQIVWEEREATLKTVTEA